MSEKASTTHNFGYGEIPAHKHPNGGGWVADTARVPDTLHVPETASIGDSASIGYRASIGNRASIGYGASIGEKELVPAVDLPPVGYPVHGWKKLADNCIAEIEVPAEAQRVCGIDGGLKCRAEYVKVLAIFAPNNSPKSKAKGAYSGTPTIYEVGAIVKPDSYDPDPSKSCANGIHFFVSRREAVAYNA